MFKDKEEELKRLEQLLLEEEPEEEPAEEPEEVWDEEPEEAEELAEEPEDAPTGSNRGLVIAACLLAVGIAAISFYLLIRYGGLFS